MRRPDDSHAGDDAVSASRRRILVVDDEATVREVVGQYLELEGFAVSAAATGLDALREAAAAPPDMVILDISLPGVDGLEVLRRLRAVSAVPILMLTARAEDVDKLLGFGLGADDYMTKPFNPRELVARVQAIMRRLEATSAPAMIFDGDIHFGDITIHQQLRQVERAGAPIELTTKEYDLLLFLATHPRQVFTREQLLQQVWNYENYGDDSTVTVHMRRLREKIERDPARPLRLRTVWGVGYKFEP
jgi:DNA-binding response OmpR family regulator